MNSNLKKLTLSALFAALIFALTALLKIPLPAQSGYVHAGDTAVFAACLFLPLPYAAAAGALGAACADILGGFTIYAPFTFVIKAVMCLPFFLPPRAVPTLPGCVIRAALSGAAGCGLYFLSDLAVFGRGAAAANLPGNLAQAGICCLLFGLCAAVLSAPGVRGQLKPRLRK